MYNRIIKRLTNNYKEVPLFWVDFNLEKYINQGKKNSCMIKIHPELKNDGHIRSELNDLIDYIRDNYDMERLSK